MGVYIHTQSYTQCMGNCQNAVLRCTDQATHRMRSTESRGDCTEIHAVHIAHTAQSVVYNLLNIHNDRE